MDTGKFQILSNASSSESSLDCPSPPRYHPELVKGLSRVLCTPEAVALLTSMATPPSVVAALGRVAAMDSQMFDATHFITGASTREALLALGPLALLNATPPLFTFIAAFLHEQFPDAAMLVRVDDAPAPVSETTALAVWDYFVNDDDFHGALAALHLFAEAALPGGGEEAVRSFFMRRFLPLCAGWGLHPSVDLDAVPAPSPLSPYSPTHAPNWPRAFHDSACPRALLLLYDFAFRSRLTSTPPPPSLLLTSNLPPSNIALSPYYLNQVNTTSNTTSTTSNSNSNALSISHLISPRSLLRARGGRLPTAIPAHFPSKPQFWPFSDISEPNWAIANTLFFSWSVDTLSHFAFTFCSARAAEVLRENGVNGEVAGRQGLDGYLREVVEDAEWRELRKNVKRVTAGGERDWGEVFGVPATKWRWKTLCTVLYSVGEVGPARVVCDMRLDGGDLKRWSQNELIGRFGREFDPSFLFGPEGEEK